MKTLRGFVKNLPTILTALVLALGVWVFAVTEADPTESRMYPQSLEMDIIGLDPDLMIVNDITREVNLTVRAPSTILDQLENEPNLINVTLDLSGLEAGVHTLTPQVSIGLSPAEVVRTNPPTVFVKLDSVVSKSLPIQIKLLGTPAIGFELQTPELSVKNVLVSGPQSLVESIDQIVAEVDVENVSEDIQRTIALIPIDSEGFEVADVSLSPSNVQITIPVTQRGGYRTVVVKIITSGQIAAGYRLTNIFALPPTVTIFSSDPELVESIPGFVETTPINLNGANEDMEIRVALNLPEGISVVGNQTVTVQIGIEPIESSMNFTNVPIQIQGLAEGLSATVSPEMVDVFLSGPLYLLEELDPTGITVVIDLSDRGPGTYQLASQVLLENEELQVDAILPNTVEVSIVTITPEPEGAAAPSPTPMATPTPTPEP
jgi:YbbR domain-containing protein